MLIDGLKYSGLLKTIMNITIWEVMRPYGFAMAPERTRELNWFSVNLTHQLSRHDCPEDSL